MSFSIILVKISVKAKIIDHSYPNKIFPYNLSGKDSKTLNTYYWLTIISKVFEGSLTYKIHRSWHIVYKIWLQGQARKKKKKKKILFGIRPLNKDINGCVLTNEFPDELKLVGVRGVIKT